MTYVRDKRGGGLKRIAGGSIKRGLITSSFFPPAGLLAFDGGKKGRRGFEAIN